MEKVKGSMIYCSCGTFLNRTGQVPDFGKDVVIVDNGCKACQQRANILERSEHE